MRIIPLEPGPQIEDLYVDVLSPSFPPAELCSLAELFDLVERDRSAWVAVDESRRPLGGAIGTWYPASRVMLLSWLAVRPGLRGGGVGRALLDAALAAWRQNRHPCLILAEVEDPTRHAGTELTGDPVARLRFYRRLGARSLALPYFQPALRPGQPRVADLLLMVLHADPELRGRHPDTIAAGALREFFQTYQRECEGRVGTDAQTAALGGAIDAHPDGVPLRDGEPDHTSAATSTG